MRAPPYSAQALVDDIVALCGRAVAHEGSADDPAAAGRLVETTIAMFGNSTY